MVESQFFIQLLILLGSITVITTLCNLLKLPTIVGFIITGVTIGPFGLGLVPSVPNAEFVAEMAVVFLMFTIGLEFSLKTIISLKREFIRTGLLQVALTIGVIAFAASKIGNFPVEKGVFLGFLIALSSTALVMKLLQDARDLESPYGKSALSILLSQDLVVIPMMLVLPLLAGTNPSEADFSIGTLVKLTGQIIGLVASLWLTSRYLLPLILDQVVATKSREVFFFAIIFFCLGIGYIFQGAGLSLSLGAFAAGLMLAEGPYGRQVTADIVPLRDNFLGIFFASIGMMLDLKFLATHSLEMLALGSSLFLIKALIIFIVAKINRHSNSVSLILGLILAQVGEFSFILAHRGLKLGLLGRVEEQYFLAVSILSMIATPFLFKLAPKLALSEPTTRWMDLALSTLKPRVQQSQPKKPSHDSNHAIIIGFGISGQNLGAAFDSLGIPFKVIELNYQEIKKLQKKGVDIHFGDASRPEVLRHAHIDTASLVIIAISGTKLIGPILRTVRSLRPDVQVIVRAPYVRDLQDLAEESLTDVVVGEIETSVELLARALKVYGISSDEIRQYMEQARNQLHTYANARATLRSPSLTLPSWEALSSIRPLQIKDGYQCLGKPLAELALPRDTGAVIASVYREDLGTTIPTGDFTLAPGDIIHLIGNPSALKDAEIKLKGEPTDLI